MKYKNELISVLKNTVLFDANAVLMALSSNLSFYPESYEIPETIETSRISEITPEVIFNHPKYSKNTIQKSKTKTNDPSILQDSFSTDSLSIIPQNIKTVFLSQPTTPQETPILPTILQASSNGDPISPILLQTSPTENTVTSPSSVFNNIAPVSDKFDIIFDQPLQSSTISELPYTSMPSNKGLQSSSVDFINSIEPIPQQLSIFPTELKTPESLSVLFNSDTTIQPQTKVPFPSISSEIESTPVVYNSSEKNPPNNVNLISQESKEFDIIPPALEPIYEKINSSVPQEISFNRKFMNNAFFPDIIHQNKIKRNLFSNLLGNASLHKILQSSLQEIPAFKYGGEFKPNDMNFSTIASNEPGSRSPESVTIKPNNTPLVSITKIKNSSSNTNLDKLEEGGDVDKAFDAVVQRIAKLEKNQPSTPKITKEGNAKYPSNIRRGLNESIMIYYDQFK